MLQIRRWIIFLGIFILVGCGKAESSSKEDFAKENLPQSEVEKQQIILCSGAYGEYMKTIVDAYNQESDKYEIIVYQKGEGEDVFAFRNRVQAELSSGEGPDVLDVYALQNIDFVPYAQKGLLLDLTEFISRAGEISDKVLDYNRWEGGIYGMPSSFRLECLMYVRDLDVDPADWNAQLCMKKVEDSKIPYFCARSKWLKPQNAGIDILNQLGVGRDGIQLFVDEKNATCDFSGEEFRTMLEFAKAHADVEGTGNDGSKRMLNGEVFFSEKGIGSFRDFWRASSYCQGEEKYIGYPSPNGEVYGMEVRGFFVNARTKQEEGVKDFLQFVLSDEVQEKISMDQDGYFPVRMDTLRKLWADAKKEVKDEGYETDLSGKVLYQPRVMTKEEERIFWHMLEHSAPVYFQNTVDDILWEEAGYYFSDEKTAEEVAETIQNRVANYLKETQN